MCGKWKGKEEVACWWCREGVKEGALVQGCRLGSPSPWS
jgi:hypothetical protein